MLLLILGEGISWVKQGKFSNKAVELYATECKSKNSVFLILHRLTTSFDRLIGLRIPK